jgi:hypothetical protein
MPRAVTDLDIRDVRSEEKGDLGLVAAMIRTAIELAEGRGVFRLAYGSRGRAARIQAQEREWLRSGAWEPFVYACGADPAPIRAELERRFEWMRRDAPGGTVTAAPVLRTIAR